MSNGNEEAIKRALESGRSHEDIAKDLADDGLLNNSHLLGSTERLIESNGETQDVIERATETAQKLQKLLTTIIPTTFNDSVGSRISYRKSISCHTCSI